MNDHDRKIMIHTAAWVAIIVCGLAGVALLVLDTTDGRLGEQSIFGMVLLGMATVIGSAFAICGQLKHVADSYYSRGVDDGRRARVVDLTR